ncbi:uncharacterized protein SAPINGB_P003694 [Magnusiomyces paraingens]|uniref:tRNA (adenine(58)-N(1))-methyltransferase catalytic subunit TRM61 n=1 Tax=Magnusiomyces paraingens TaxID=2606893 RepID=A0A5E8BW22_9ASCO|nr:uncharacterized protein SAPINGB_P003694 [Saprochaete ingens]VVT53677.1 unnamed protein product [Saprochaete ingens]
MVLFTSKTSSLLARLGSRVHIATYRTFQPGDIVLARHVLRPDRPILSTPLGVGKEWTLGNSSVPHESIIGQPVRTTVSPLTKRGAETNQTFILTLPSLDEYTVHRKRQAQPIYPLDAAAIVSLADIHEDETGACGYGRVTGTARDLETSDEELVQGLPAEGKTAVTPIVPIKMRQYLEAGTGHGSLTLAISKAIHAANGDARRLGDLSLRGAVLHSIDRNASHSRTGRHNVRDFRNGMYYGDVEFHVSDSPEQWLAENEGEWRARGIPEEPAQGASAETPGSFLSGAFLDLPSPDTSVTAIAQRLIVDAPLVVFCPSVTQIQDIVEHIRVDESIDLTLANTVELMPGIAGGSMRAWDVRSAVIRQTGEVARVCRPRVGTGVGGGGFVAVFRKLPHQARIKLRLMKEAKQESKDTDSKDTESQNAPETETLQEITTTI